MKKLVTFIVLAVFLFACNTGLDKGKKIDTVYLSKPAINDSTVLKAHFEVRMWVSIFQILSNQARKIGTEIDTAQARKSKDSVYMVINTINKALSDTVVNKPYF